jgi:hypothetical protein
MKEDTVRQTAVRMIVMLVGTGLVCTALSDGNPMALIVTVGAPGLRGRSRVGLGLSRRPLLKNLKLRRTYSWKG